MDWPRSLAAAGRRCWRLGRGGGSTLKVKCVLIHHSTGAAACINAVRVLSLSRMRFARRSNLRPWFGDTLWVFARLQCFLTDETSRQFSAAADLAPATDIAREG